MRSKRHADRDLLDTYHSMGCVICGISAEPAHIQSRGAGGPDVDFNVMALCRAHHTEQHKIGWDRMARRHPAVSIQLQSKGWYFDQFGLQNDSLLKFKS